MIKWAPYVFVRLTAYLIAGILPALYLPVSSATIQMLFVAFYTLVTGYLGICLLKRLYWKTKKFSTLAGLLAMTILFLTGFLLTYQRNAFNHPEHLLHQSGDIRFYTGVIVSEVTTGHKSHKAQLEIKQIYQQNQWIAASGKVLLYLDNKMSKPRYGDKLVIKGRPQRVPAPANPGEFNYRKYLQLQQIYHQHFVKQAGAVICGYDPPFRLMAISIGLRQYADDIFRKLIPTQREQAIASGLVLGIRDGLDNAIKEAYASAGAMHILAVSGAHVAIVIHILVYMLGRIKTVRYGKLLFAVLVLSLIWMYAFVTGLSASALRAVIMYSFIIIANACTRQTSIYNTLALSAFILLCYDPYLLMDVGFQLSYAAMLSIVYITPQMSHLLESDNRVLNYFWLITCASLAAQIGTVPLSLLYFHQFPVYFLLANLVVIPLSAGILYVGIATLFFSFVPYVSTVLAFLLKGIIGLLNQVAFVTESLPGALVKNVSVSAIETGVLYLIIVCFFLFLYYKKLMYWSVVVGLAGLLAICNVVEIHKQRQQQQLTIYSIANHTAIGVVNGGNNYLMADSALLHNQNTLDFHLASHWRETGVSQHLFANFFMPESSPLAFRSFQEYSLLVWQGKTFVFIHKAINNWQPIASLQPDYLVVQLNALKDLGGKESFIKYLIIDGSNKAYIASKLQQQALKANIPCYSIRDEGAFMLSRNYQNW